MTAPLPVAGRERCDFLVYYAGVLLREARSRRGQNVTWMIEGAARARREAQAIDLSPAQADLFATPPNPAKG